MNNEEIELTWLDNHHTLSFDELMKLSGLSQATLQLLVENGALTPSQPNKVTSSQDNINNWHFSSHHLLAVRTLSRLQRDFELENNSLSLIMLYLERIQTLETQLKYSGNHHDY